MSGKGVGVQYKVERYTEGGVNAAQMSSIEIAYSKNWLRNGDEKRRKWNV